MEPLLVARLTGGRVETNLPDVRCSSRPSVGGITGALGSVNCLGPFAFWLLERSDESGSSDLLVKLRGRYGWSPSLFSRYLAASLETEKANATALDIR